MDELWHLWAQWGLAGLVVGFSLWRDWQRERLLHARLDAHEQWLRTHMLQIIDRNTAVMARLEQCMGHQQ